MKILLLGSHMHYNLEHYVYMNLFKLGHEVKFYGYKEKLGRLVDPIRMAITRSKLMRDAANLLWLNRINNEIKRVAKAFCPDLVLSIKGEAVKPETIEWMREELGAKTALWYPDDPRFFSSLVRYIAPSYGHVFTASKRAIDAYRRVGVKNVHFLPFACEPTVHRRVKLTDEEKRKYGADVVFVGTYTPRRARIIGMLGKAGLKVRVFGPYWKYFRRHFWISGGAIYGSEMVKAFNAAKIVLNIHVKEDLSYKINMRTFEATGSGTFLLTDKPHGLGEEFSIDKEVICYSNKSELIKLVKYYINDEAERIKIANEAQKRAYKYHTYKQRAQKLIDILS